MALAPDCVACPVRSRHVDGPVDDDSLVRLSSVLARRSYREGQTLHVQGHAADRVFFIRAGAVRLSRQQGDGGEMLLDFVGPGGVIGVGALFGAEHVDTATACGEVSCCTAPAATLRGLLPDQPGVAVALVRMLRDDVDRLRERVAELASFPAEQRVALFLLETLPAWRASVARFTQTEIARSLALAPETLSRILADFRQRRWIDGQGPKLRVIETEPLARIAGRTPAS